MQRLDRNNLAEVVKATLGYSLIALLGVWLIRDAGWSPIATLAVLVTLFVATVAAMALGGRMAVTGRELAVSRLEPVPVCCKVAAGTPAWRQRGVR